MNPDTPWTVRSLWVGPKMTEMEWASLTSFVMHGARYELYTDDLRREVPQGVMLRDCRELLGEELPRYGPRGGAGAGSFAIAADLARVRALYRMGGWWVDTDVICLKSFCPIDAGLQVAWEDLGRFETVANLAVLRLPPRSHLARTLLRRIRFPWFGSPWETPIRRVKNFRHLFDTILRPYNVPWGWSAGPRALTDYINHYGLTNSVLPPEVFYPVHSVDWESILSMPPEQFTQLSSQSYSVHLWAEMYRRAGLDKGRAIRSAPWSAPYLSSFPDP
jgi:Alpha 1,4-glycosyltransferase conserved region/Glycosyltransferase sugar-binding region containing DXD motif